MIEVEDSMDVTNNGRLSPAAWDATVLTLGGTLTQTWARGELERRYAGARVNRVHVEAQHGVGLAQVMFHRAGPVVMAEIKQGPLLSDDNVAPHLFAAIDHVCERHRALGLRIEPLTPLPMDHIPGPPFVAPPRPRPMTRTLVVPLLDDDALLAQMRKQTRYYVRLGQRRGDMIQVVERPGTGAPELAIFYRMLTETAERNDFPIRPLEYYADAFGSLGDNAALLVARHDGEPAAVEAVIRFGTSAASLWAASSTTHRQAGTTSFLFFEAMRWARDHGCTGYDMWGLPPDPDAMADDGAPPSRGADQAGIYHFKVGFGGTIVDFPPAVERHYRPLLLQGLRPLREAGSLLPFPRKSTRDR